LGGANGGRKKGLEEGTGGRLGCIKGKQKQEEETIKRIQDGWSGQASDERRVMSDE
jgi:hypothetical protein